MIYRLIALINILFVMFSCSSHKKEASVETAIDLNKQAFIKEIPRNAKGRYTLSFLLDQDKVLQLGLDSLTNGYDSIAIRIWCNRSLSSKNDLILIQKNNTGWSCQYFGLKIKWDSEKMKELILQKNIVFKTPKSGWKSFLDKLYAFNILTLPDQQSVPGYKEIAGADGTSYCIEISTKQKYRYYTYWQPQDYKDDYVEAREMVDVLDLVQSEFDVNFKDR